VRYTALGEVTARGREEPVAAWVAEETLLPPGARPTRAATPLVGRDEELGLLTRSIDTAVIRGRALQMLVVAEAGMGKTRLAEEVAELAECNHGVTVLEGRCVPYGEANVWWPVAEALRTTCEVGLDDPEELARERVIDRTRTGLPSVTDAEVERVANGILHLMGYEGPLAGIDPTRAREEVIRSLQTFIEGFARQRPVIVLLSDLHWADDLVLELSDRLLERLATLPVVLIGTARTDLFERWQPRPGRHNQLVLNLDPLSREATGALFDSMVESPMPHELREQIVDRSGGNPFFLEELVSLLAEAGAPVDSDTVPRSAVDLPHTLRGLVAARLDALDVDERRTLEDAAVLGRRGNIVALELMAKEAHLVDSGVARALGGLVAKDILTVDEGRWSFRSDLVREVAYGMLTKADRARRHHGVAKWMEQHPSSNPADVDRIAHHYATAAALVNDVGTVEWVSTQEVQMKASHWLRKAVEQAEAGELNLVVVHLCDHALDLGDALPATDRVDFLLARAAAYANLRDLKRAGTDVDAAADTASTIGDDCRRAAALVARGDLEQKAGDLDDSAVTLQLALDAYRKAGDEAGQAAALRAYGMTMLFSGRDAEAESSFTDALAQYRALGDRRGEAWALQNLAWVAYTTGDAARAESRLHKSIEAFTEMGDSGGLGWAVGLLAFVRYHQGQFDEAQQLAEQMLVEARDRGDRWAEGMMQGLLGMLALWSGRATEAVTFGSESLTLFRDMNDWYGQLLAVGVYARALVASGRIDEGFEALQEGAVVASGISLEQARDMTEGILAATAAQAGIPERGPQRRPHDLSKLDTIGFTDRAIADALLDLQEGDAAAARESLEHVVAGLTTPVPYATSALAMARAAAGDPQLARDAALEVIGSDDATYADRITALIAGGLAAAQGDDAATAHAMLRSAQELADGTEDRLMQALTRLAEARADGRIGTADAPERLRRAFVNLATLGVSQPGWDTAFRLAAGTGA
jgi:predicted ATPase